MHLLLVPEHGLHILRPVGDFDGGIMLEELRRITAAHPEILHQNTLVDRRHYAGVSDYDQMCEMAALARSVPGSGLPLRRLAIVSLDPGLRFVQALAARIFQGHEITLYDSALPAYLTASAGRPPGAAARGFLGLIRPDPG